MVAEYRARSCRWQGIAGSRRPVGLLFERSSGDRTLQERFVIILM
jgi:hypothetical protein